MTEHSSSPTDGDRDQRLETPANSSPREATSLLIPFAILCVLVLVACFFISDIWNEGFTRAMPVLLFLAVAVYALRLGYLVLVRKR